MKELLTRLKNILVPSEKRQLVFLGAGVMFLSLLETFSIAIVFPLMTLFIFPEKINSTPVLSWLYHLCGSPDVFFFVVFLVSGAFLLLLARAVYSVWVLYQKQKILADIYSRLTSKILQSYLDKPYSYHLVSNSSELFKNTSSEASNCVNYLLNPVITVSSEAVILLGICLFLIYAYPVLTVSVFVIFGSVALLVNILFKKRIKAYSSQREIFNAMMFKDALESFGAVKEIQIYNAHDYFISRYFSSTRNYNKALVKFNTISGLPKHILEIAFAALTLLGAILVAYSHKSFVELIPVIVVFGVAMMRLLSSFSKIYENVAYLHFGVNSLDIVSGILKQDKHEKNHLPHSSSLLSDEGRQDKTIRLKDVTFCYQTAAHSIFEGINISFPLYRISAIAGETGSGKSTAIDIITGLLTPQKGSLCFCGLPINQNNICKYQAKIGYVPQHIFLVDDTIAANVAFGILAEKIDRKRVEYALKLAQLDSFVKSLHDGVDTKVGERGARISGGQRQRIGIARALYRNPEILILDEASSALDGRTESQLYAALKDLKDKVTIILVTHRLATLEHADLIYVLEHGKIVDRGDYNELLLRSQVFQRIASQKVLSQEAVEELGKE